MVFSGTSMARGTTTLALWVLAAACNPRPDRPEDAGALSDDAGRTIALETPARRIVSLSPAITELLFALGAGDRVVGRTQWGADPPAALDVPSVGDGLNPNIEVVLARRPDLVVFYRSSANASAIARLEALGIASAQLALDSLGSVARAARVLGRLLGEPMRGDSLAGVFRAKLDSARATVVPGTGPRVVMLSWDQPPIVIGGGSFLTELVSLAGGVNVFGDVRAPSATVTVETIVDRRPDLVLMFSETPPVFFDRPAWQAVAAVRNRRWAQVTGTAFSYPSPRAFAAVARLRRAFRGDP